MLLRSPLDEAHRALGAKMAPFGGWSMPISYAGTVREHEAVRERVGLFDVSHLGKILVTGRSAREFLDAQLSNRMTTLTPGRARYTLMLNERAGILDDLIVYGLADDELLVVPNAANREGVYRRLLVSPPAGVEVRVLEWSTIAVQGPLSTQLVAAHLPFAKDLAYMEVAREGDITVARSGYTGEVGYEVFTTASDATQVWEALLATAQGHGGLPCGLAARDTLRLEMGYPLHGNDIGPETTPAEAGLMWAVAAKDRTFVGADALRAHTPAWKLVGLRALDKVIPRAGCAVLAPSGEEVGRCTSGTFSPTLRVGIALAYVALDAAGADELQVDVRAKRGRVRVVKPPFVDRSPK